MSLNKAPANQCNQLNLSNQCKIFVGDTRIVSKISDTNDANVAYEQISQYYYHGDHLGSSNYVTDYQGQQFEHIEYTPYGETWVEESKDTLNQLNFKFSSKKEDRETGLYCFPKRYYDPQVSRWMSSDPIYDGVKDGMSIYGYCYNNPLIYHDPSGLETKDKQFKWYNPFTWSQNNKKNETNTKTSNTATTPATTKEQTNEEKDKIFNSTTEKLIKDVSKVYRGARQYSFKDKMYTGGQHKATDIIAGNDDKGNAYTGVQLIIPYEKASVDIFSETDYPGPGNSAYVYELDDQGNKTGNRFFSCHLDTFADNLKSGDILNKNDIYGVMGKTGTQSNDIIHAHIQLETKINGVYVPVQKQGNLEISD